MFKPKKLVDLLLWVNVFVCICVYVRGRANQFSAKSILFRSFQNEFCLIYFSGDMFKNRSKAF